MYNPFVRSDVSYSYLLTGGTPRSAPSEQVSLPGKLFTAFQVFFFLTAKFHYEALRLVERILYNPTPSEFKNNAVKIDHR